MNLSLKNTLLAVGALALPLISTAVAGSSSVQDMDNANFFFCCSGFFVAFLITF